MSRDVYSGPMFRAFGWLVATGLSLVLAHDLTFLARYGSAYGEALAHAGHGAGWDRAVATILVLAALVALGALARLRALSRDVTVTVSRSADAEAVPGRARVAGRWASDWIRLSAVVGGLLTLQENVERLLAGLTPPGVLALLSPEYAFGWLIVVAVAAVMACVVALYRWRRSILIARRTPRDRHVSTAVPAASPLDRGLRARQSLLGRRGGLRAPPLRAG
jgi:hypothetical protein